VAGGALGTSIGTLNEGHLHASLKERCVEPGDQVEVDVDGYVVDILRADYPAQLLLAVLFSMTDIVDSACSWHSSGGLDSSRSF